MEPEKTTNRNWLAESEARGKALAAVSKEFEGFGDAMQMHAVIGLIDLLKERDCSEGVGNSWLGQFLEDVLVDIALGRLLRLENHPAKVLARMQKYVASFEDDIEQARDLAGRYAEFEPLVTADSDGGAL